MRNEISMNLPENEAIAIQAITNVLDERHWVPSGPFETAIVSGREGSSEAERDYEKRNSVVLYYYLIIQVQGQWGIDGLV